MKVRQLRTGDLGVGLAGEVLFTGGVGSCVVVCLWDASKRAGGMAHMLLPKDESEGRDILRSPGLSPDTAVAKLLEKLAKYGSNAATLSARLAGAGYMFGESMREIPERNLQSTLEVLKRHRIRVVSQSVGGIDGLQVRFDIGLGEVEVTKVSGERILL